MQNCNSTQNTYTLNPANSWVYNWWSTSSGLTTISSSSSNIKVQATSTTATGTQFVKAKMKWKDASGATCGTKYITKSIGLTGFLNSEDISIDINAAADLSGYNICSTGENMISVFYDGFGDVGSWEWSFPNGWEVEMGYNDLYIITSAPTSGTVNIRGRNGCGTSAWKSFYIYSNECTGELDLLIISPNPAANEVSLEENSNVDTNIKEKNEYDVVFYKNTRMVNKHSSVQVGDKINISRLNKGTYIVHIIAPDKTVIKTRIMVDR